MAKDKLPKTKGVPNKHLHARTTFLYQAATYLTLQTVTSKPGASGTPMDTSQENKTLTPGYSGLAIQLGSDLHSVSRKGQIRLNVDLKRNICKSCNSVLIAGRTATHEIENQSKGAKKPWADVLVVGCTICGSKKRFPVGAKRQLKKNERR
ncbi:Rpr2-domain-containing protein, partial [Byssothecium circinans]